MDLSKRQFQYITEKSNIRKTEHLLPHLAPVQVGSDLLTTFRLTPLLPFFKTSSSSFSRFFLLSCVLAFIEQRDSLTGLELGGSAPT